MYGCSRKITLCVGANTAPGVASARRRPSACDQYFGALALSEDSCPTPNVQFWTSLADLAVKCSKRTAIGLAHLSGIPHLLPTSIIRKQRKSGLILAVPWLQITCNVPSLITGIDWGKSSTDHTALSNPINITPLRLFWG
jgi:hypothetical protein